jgi:hypothetical protein
VAERDGGPIVVAREPPPARNVSPEIVETDDLKSLDLARLVPRHDDAALLSDGNDAISNLRMGPRRS